jgi:hypothetical protein
MKIGQAIGDQDAVNGFFEDIDRRNAKKTEALRINPSFQSSFRLIEGQNDIQFLTLNPGEGFLETGQLEEQKAWRESEILAQQPVAFEAVRRRRQERLIGGKAHTPDTIRR